MRHEFLFQLLGCFIRECLLQPAPLGRAHVPQLFGGQVQIPELPDFVVKRPRHLNPVVLNRIRAHSFANRLDLVILFRVLGQVGEDQSLVTRSQGFVIDLFDNALCNAPPQQCSEHEHNHADDVALDDHCPDVLLVVDVLVAFLVVVRVLTHGRLDGRQREVVHAGQSLAVLLANLIILGFGVDVLQGVINRCLDAREH